MELGSEMPLTILHIAHLGVAECNLKVLGELTVRQKKFSVKKVSTANPRQKWSWNYHTDAQSVRVSIIQIEWVHV